MALFSSTTKTDSCSISPASRRRRSYSATWSWVKYMSSRSTKRWRRPCVEGTGRERHARAALDVEGDHAVVEQVVLALGDDLDPALASTKTGSCSRCWRTKSQAPCSVPASRPNRCSKPERGL